MGFCVYILYSASSDKYYVGQTEDLQSRIVIHNNPFESRKFTAKGIPWTLKLKLPCDSRSTAMMMERYIKSMKSRIFIERLLTDHVLQNELIAKFST